LQMAEDRLGMVVPASVTYLSAVAPIERSSQPAASDRSTGEAASGDRPAQDPRTRGRGSESAPEAARGGGGGDGGAGSSPRVASGTIGR
jgi:hypothetical protein